MTETQAVTSTIYVSRRRNDNRSDREAVGIADANGYWLVFEGDWGGQIYLTVPLAMVGPNARIFDLLKEIDDREWACNEGDGATVLAHNPEAVLNEMRANGADEAFIEEMRADMTHYSGGCGGGELTDGLWLGVSADPDHVRVMLDMHT